MAEGFMAEALRQAEAAGALGEVPVGAVVALAGRRIAAAGNRVRTLGDPTAHAEILALRAACAALGSHRLDGAELHVTLEPCAMCAAACMEARIAKLCYGAADPKGGAVDHGVRLFAAPGARHRPEVIGGIDERRCAALLKAFFAARRRPSKVTRP